METTRKLRKKSFSYSFKKRQDVTHQTKVGMYQKHVRLLKNTIKQVTWKIRKRSKTQNLEIWTSFKLVFNHPPKKNKGYLKINIFIEKQYISKNTIETEKNQVRIKKLKS